MKFKNKRTHRLLVSTLVFFSSFQAVYSRDIRGNGEVKSGMASWYGPKFHGRKTANGEVFDQQKLTCASNLYPLGTWLRVTNLRNRKSVVVKVNDRMSPKMHRVVDLSRGAGAAIGIEKSGVGRVEVENLGRQPVR